MSSSTSHLLVLLPLGALVLKSASIGWDQFWKIAFEAAGDGGAAALLRRGDRSGAGRHRVRRHHRLVPGALQIPGRRIIDAAVDLPFALPPAVAGIALRGALRAAGNRSA